MAKQVYRKSHDRVMIAAKSCFREVGIYSTTNDLSKLLRSILNHDLLSPIRTNAWLKPRSFAQSLHTASGMPWEILRTTQLTGDGHAIDIYMKHGLVIAYSSVMMLIPEYNLGVTILTAGDDLPAIDALENAVVMTTLPEVEKIQRETTRKQYAGHYKSPNLNSSITLDVSEHTGVTITEWISNGTEFLSVFKRIRDPGREGVVRLHPTGTRFGKNGELWVAVTTPAEKRRKFVFDDDCVRNVESETFNGRQLADIVIWKDGEEVSGMQLRGLRVDLEKVEGRHDGELGDDPQTVLQGL